MGKLMVILPNEQLKHERQRRGWSRAYVADEIGLADPKTVGRWERGICLPSAHFLQKLCTLFEVLPQELGLYHAPNTVSAPNLGRVRPKIESIPAIRYNTGTLASPPGSDPMPELLLDYLKQCLSSIDAQTLPSTRWDAEGFQALTPALAVVRGCDIPEYVTDKTDKMLVIFLPSYRSKC